MCYLFSYLHSVVFHFTPHRFVRKSDMADDPDMLTKVYTDRNQIVQLAARLAKMNGIESGIRASTVDSDWPVIVFMLPEGEIAWHVPRAELLLDRRRDLLDAEYDGHTDKEKAQRIKTYMGKTSDFDHS